MVVHETHGIMGNVCNKLEVILLKTLRQRLMVHRQKMFLKHLETGGLHMLSSLLGLCCLSVALQRKYTDSVQYQQLSVLTKYIFIQS